MTAKDYILKQNGKTVWLNEAGMQLVKDAVDAAGGGVQLAEMIPCSNNTLSKLKTFGCCGPDIWEKFFEVSKKLIAA